MIDHLVTELLEASSWQPYCWKARDGRSGCRWAL